VNDPSGLATVRLYSVRLLGISVGTDGALVEVKPGRMLTADPDPVSTNLRGSAAALVTDDVLLRAAAGRLPACPEVDDDADTATGTASEVAVNTNEIASEPACRTTRERTSPWPTRIILSPGPLGPPRRFGALSSSTAHSERAGS